MPDKEPIKYLDIAEFRELGFLQEVNRRVLHPAGLALEIHTNDDGTATFGGVWDYREDPEGIAYAGELAKHLGDKARSVQAEIERHRPAREAMFGSLIQPLICGAIWRDEMPHVTCARSLDERGKHAGTHIYFDPKTGKRSVTWWGGQAHE